MSDAARPRQITVYAGALLITHHFQLITRFYVTGVPFMTPACCSCFSRKNAAPRTVSSCVTQKGEDMKTKSKWAMNGAAAGALALLLATPTFAQSRGDWNRNDSNRSSQNGQYNSGDSNRSPQNGQYNSGDSNRSSQNGQYNRGDSNRNTQFERRDNNSGYRENQRVNVSANVT